MYILYINEKGIYLGLLMRTLYTYIYIYIRIIQDSLLVLHVYKKKRVGEKRREKRDNTEREENFFFLSKLQSICCPFAVNS